MGLASSLLVLHTLSHNRKQHFTEHIEKLMYCFLHMQYALVNNSSTWDYWNWRCNGTSGILP